jgi:uncharacterized protein YdhG (YjbR/CyaY superfamily)
MDQDPPATIDDYIAQCEGGAALEMKRIAETVRAAVPDAVETISYGMPTFRLRRVIVHFGAFKDHIGLYPPVRDPVLAERIAPYRGEKGNLRFPLDRPIPYDLIADIATSQAAKAR